jgi:hypothetical protein
MFLTLLNTYNGCTCLHMWAAKWPAFFSFNLFTVGIRKGTSQREGIVQASF